MATKETKKTEACLDVVAEASTSNVECANIV